MVLVLAGRVLAGRVLARRPSRKSEGRVFCDAVQPGIISSHEVVISGCVHIEYLKLSIDIDIDTERIQISTDMYLHKYDV